MIANDISRAAEWGATDESGAKCYPLHSGQTAIMKSTARFTAAIAGTGGGKTVLGPLWIAQHIDRVCRSRDIRTDPIIGFVVAPTYPIMARATAPTLIKTFAGTDLEGDYVESRNRYYLPNGLGLLWMLSADNPGGLEGGQVDFVWIDEGGQLKFDAWIAVQGRTGLKQSPVLITTTPYGLNWLHSDFYKRYLDGDPNYYVRQWSSNNNPAYSNTEYDRAKATMSRQRAAMRYDGQFVKAAGLVYPDLDSCVVDLSPEEEIALPPGRPVGGIDFGWNNPFAAVQASLVIADEASASRLRCKPGDDVLYVWYERYMRTTPMTSHASALPKPGQWWADPSRPDSIDELRRSGHSVRAGNNDILLGIDAVSARIYSRRLRIHSRCKALLAEAEQYQYPEKDDQVIGDKPLKDFDHAMDALRYMVVGVDRRRIARQREEAA